MKRTLLIGSSLLLLLYSCSNTNTNESETKDTIAVIDSSMLPNGDKTQYKLPSPVELYILIKEAGAKYNKEILNKPENSALYLTSTSKAVNFGVYASDLAYSTVYEKQQETHTYFKTLKDLASQLGISDGYDASIVKRIDQNLYNSDSLYQITNDSYWEVCTSLESNGKANVLAQILMGGWIESLYLAVNSVDKFNPENEIIMRITEQSYLLENMLDYLKTLQKDKETEEYMKHLTDLQYSFDKLYDNPEGVLVTKDQYKEIAEKIKSIRAALIK